MKNLFAKKYLFLLVSIFVFFLLAFLTPLFGQDVHMAAVLIVYISSAIIVLKAQDKRKDRLISILIILAPPFVLESWLHIVSFRSSLVSLPTYLAYFVGVLFGTVIYYSKKNFQIAWGICVIGLAIFIPAKGFNYWLNKINYGTFFMQVNERIPGESKLNDDIFQALTTSKSSNHIIVLDFWTTACGICFEKFPLVQQKMTKYASNPRIVIFTVNEPLKRDTTGQAEQVLKIRNYKFNNLNLRSSDEAKRWGVSCYPTTIVIYHNRILYRGDIEGVDDCIATLL